MCVMNTTPAPSASSGAPTGMDGFFASIRRTGIVRSEERWIGGVAGGLALRMGIDPLIVRGLLGASVLLGGIGLVLYGVGWLLLPDQRDGRIHLQQLFRGDFDAAVIGGFLALLIGFAFPSRWGPGLGWGGNDWWGGFVGLVAIVVIIAVVASSAARNRTPGGPPFVPPPTPVQPTTQLRPEATTMYPAPPAPPGTAPQGTAPQGPAPRAASYGAYGVPYGAPPSYSPPPSYGTAPSYGTPRPVVAPPTLPPQPKPAGPGGRIAGIVVALGLLVLAALLYAERVDAFDGPVLLTTAAVVVILCGLGIVVAGGFGRTSGGLGAIALVTILVVAPVAAISVATISDVSLTTTNAFVGSVTYVPTDVATAEGGYRVLAGEVIIDLTELPARGDAIEVPVHLGAGKLRLVLPEEGAYTADVRLVAGEVIWLDEAPISGVNAQGWDTFDSPAVADGATPRIELDITVGAGSLIVEEES